MKLTLGVTSEIRHLAVAAIQTWEEDSCIRVSESDGVWTLTNSGNNIIVVSGDKITFSGRRHALMAGPSNACSDVFIRAGILTWEGQATATGKVLPVIEYKTMTPTEPWWEYGITHPALSAAMERWNRAGIWPINPDPDAFDTLAVEAGEIVWKTWSSGQVGPAIKWTGQDYRRAAAVGITL